MRVAPFQRPARPATQRGRRRGVALLTAMIVVALIATLASAMLWRQWRSVEVEAAERSRAQASWILAGALDWARLILREDRRAGGPDHLAEPWATPLAEARLSTFLAADREHTDDATEAFLSGRISDAQARFNLNNIALAPPPAVATAASPSEPVREPQRRTRRVHAARCGPAAASAPPRAHRLPAPHRPRCRTPVTSR